MADTTPPVITPESPLPGAIGVVKSAPIIFTIVDPDSGVNPSTVRVLIRGDLTYDGVHFFDGWKSSTVEGITDGYRITLIPDRIQYARANEEHIVGVTAEDIDLNKAAESWVFTAVSDFSLTTYRFILGSIRNKDEEV